METVAQPPADAELHLLTEWGDSNARSRTRTAAVISVVLHAVVIFLLILIPPDVIKVPVNRVVREVTPLVEPLTELTQKTPNTGKVSKEFNAVEVQPRPRIRIPAPPPPRPVERAAAMPPPVSAPATKPRAVPLPEAPAVPQPAPQQAAPKSELPQLAVASPPQIQATEKKSPFETPGAPPASVAPGKGQVPIPDTSVSGAVRQTIRGSSGGAGTVVGDAEAMGAGGGVGMSQAPTPGAHASAMQLLSDPMGVDFRPYLTQILTIVRRNWFSVMPESAKLGLRGRVGVLVAIARNGTVTKANFAAQSGARALDQAAIAAISMSNPFPPLPSEYKGDRVVLQFNFAYNIAK
jgi:TonB family protein